VVNEDEYIMIDMISTLRVHFPDGDAEGPDIGLIIVRQSL